MHSGVANSSLWRSTGAVASMLRFPKARADAGESGRPIQCRSGWRPARPARLGLARVPSGSGVRSLVSQHCTLVERVVR